jgi:hypothetical protein
VDVSELTAGNVDLAVQLAFVEGVSFKREGYRVRFELERAMVQRVFDAIPVTGDPRNPNLRFSATTVNVVLSGPEDVLAALEPAHIVARVNTESALRTGRGRRIEFPILVDELPARVELISIEPAMVATVP